MAEHRSLGELNLHIVNISAQGFMARGELAIVPVEGLSFVRTFKIVYHKNKYLSPAMQFFIDLVLRTPAAQLLPPQPSQAAAGASKSNPPPTKDIPIWL